ncbi:MAG: RNA polymerase sigma factor [Planctomycetota bacterium]|nr:RNA polymerase sigma factor [Planctomycetota bacterium]
MDSQIKKLLKRARKADTHAASELLRIYYEDVYSYLRRLCGNQADAEDLTQQTFLKVWSSLDHFKGRSRFSTWLHRIAYNCYVDWRRRNTGGTLNLPDQWWLECVDDNPGPFSNLAERQLTQRLYEAVDQLEENKKQTVHLHYYQGLSLRETAKVLGVATSTVKYRLREVFKILRGKLGVRETGTQQEQTIPIAEGESL